MAASTSSVPLAPAAATHHKLNQPGLHSSTSALSNSSIADSFSSDASSSSLGSALSPVSSLACILSAPDSLTETPHTPGARTNTSEPTKGPIRDHSFTSACKPLPHTITSSRKSTHLNSPHTSKLSTVKNTQPFPNTANRRPPIIDRSPERRSSNIAAMGKKAKVGSASKSSPFTKLASIDNDADTSLATVVEDEVEASSALISTKPVEATSESKQNVVVCVRMRPSRTSIDSPVWSCDSTNNHIVPTEHHPAIAKRTTSSERAGATSFAAPAPSTDDNDATYHFQFDKLITHPQTTDDMFGSHIAPVVKASLEGYNGTVFAYGQTGSGKTHTMSGSDAEPGVIPRAVQQVFKMIQEDEDREFLLRVSYLEIYNETLKDLLAPLPTLGGSLQTTERPSSPTKPSSSTLRIIEDPKSNRVLITGLREEIVTDAQTVLDLLQRGQEERHVGATDWNERSSRSHCVFQLTIESRSRTPCSGKEVRISQLNLIDLAGSERAASQAERRKEGAFINKSLLTLGTVIGKLTEPNESSDHIPYRDSKLTRILQTSLSGNARIAVICTLSPDTEHAGETMSTLKFGKRCKLVMTTARKGTSMDDKALLQKYRRELDALRAKMDGSSSDDASTVSPEKARESRERLDELNQQKESAQKEVEDMHKQRSQLKGQIEHLTRLIVTSQSVADTAGPSTPVKAKHASVLARRGPRMSDFSYSSPVVPLPSENATKPFELETQLASLRRQLREQIVARESLVEAHATELVEREARAKELQEAIRCNEEELDEAELAYDKLKDERDEARSIALKEQEKARENGRRLAEEQEANRLLKLVAQSRASEEDEKVQEEIERLREQLKAKHGEVERFEAELVGARRVVEEEKEARARAEEERDEASKVRDGLQGELAESMAEMAELKQKVDVDAEFQSLVRKQDGEAEALLRRREAELDEREAQLERLRAEIEQTRRELEGEVTALKAELTRSEEERQTLQVELANARAAASDHKPDPQKIAALEMQVKQANAKVDQLQTEVVAEKKRREEALRKGRPLPVPLALQEGLSRTGGGSVPSSPVKTFATGGSKLRPEASASGLHRTGSVKEYRRYQNAGEEDNSSGPPSPSPASGTRSVLLNHEAVFNSASKSNKAEKEEIERLNAVINSQRAIMADLEHSVASWKTRMKAQAELIHKLMDQNHVPSPPLSDAEIDDATATTPKRKTESKGFHTLPRTTHLALAPGSEPYYGAHTFNQPPGRASPTKSFATLGSWSRQNSPSPLPVSTRMEEGAGKRRPRKTIEMDLKLLNASPRVEGGRNRFGGVADEDGTPTKRRTNASQYYI